MTIAQASTMIQLVKQNFSHFKFDILGAPVLFDI